MNNTTGARLDMLQVQVDSSEKVINAGLVDHKAELDGYKSHADGKFEAKITQMDADRMVAEANNKAMLERMDADRKAVDARMDAERKAADARHESLLKQIDAKFEAFLTEMKAQFFILKVWVIVTIIVTVSVSLAVWRMIMGS